eukprot:5581629-Prymnesium_polylepis.1
MSWAQHLSGSSVLSLSAVRSSRSRQPKHHVHWHGMVKHGCSSQHTMHVADTVSLSGFARHMAACRCASLAFAHDFPQWMQRRAGLCGQLARCDAAIVRWEKLVA